MVKEGRREKRRVEMRVVESIVSLSSWLRKIFGGRRDRELAKKRRINLER